MSKCRWCGKEIIVNKHKPGRASTFCSDNCRYTYWNYQHDDIQNKNKKAVYTIECKHCGKKFQIYGNKNRKYCSVDCYSEQRMDDTDRRYRERIKYE